MDRAHAKKLIREINKAEHYVEVLYAALLDGEALPDGVVLDQEGDDNEDDAQVGGQMGEAVRHVNENPEHVWSPKEVAEATDIPSERMGTLLSRAFHAGLIDKLARGKYRALGGR